MSSGCSYLFVTAPQGEGRYAIAGDCTSNPAAPVIDTLLSSTNALSTLYVAGQSNVTNKGQAIAVGLLATGLWLSSSIYGYYNTSKCAQLRADEGPGPYRRPPRIRRTVLSGPGGTQAMPPHPVPPPPPPQANPVPPSPPDPGAGGAGGTMVPAVRPAVPPARQQLDQDDPG